MREAVQAAGHSLNGVVIPPGVDVERFQPVRSAAERRAARVALGIDPDLDTIVGVSRLVPRKGFDVLIDAVALLEEDVQLVIAGDGRDRDRLEDRAQRLGPRRRARTSSVGSRRRTCPRCTGVPTSSRWCVASGGAGSRPRATGSCSSRRLRPGCPRSRGGAAARTRRSCDDETGWVVDPLDVIELHHALERLVLEPARRARMGAAARLRAEQECAYERRVAALATLAAGDLSGLTPFPEG